MTKDTINSRKQRAEWGKYFNTSSRQKVNALPMQRVLYNLIRKIEMAQIDKWVKVFSFCFFFLAVLQHEGS